MEENNSTQTNKEQYDFISKLFDEINDHEVRTFDSDEEAKEAEKKEDFLNKKIIKSNITNHSIMKHIKELECTLLGYKIITILQQDDLSEKELNFYNGFCEVLESMLFNFLNFSKEDNDFYKKQLEDKQENFILKMAKDNISSLSKFFADKFNSKNDNVSDVPEDNDASKMTH
jgi:hypothetical protein